ncbi:MAG: NapC/NirT family cytochrome c [Terriglobales bacterium]
MTLNESFRGWARPVYHLGQNAISLVGAVLVTSSALTMVAFWFYDFFLPGPPHPYIGILIFLILPGIFVLGLVLIPVGIVLRRAKLLAEGTLPTIYPAIDLGQPVVRRGLEWVGFATVLNLLIIGTASYRGVSYMDSTQFCGLTCHTVMAPEYTAYQNSPHSRVECVECHIGPGAPWFVRSKLSGLRQVFAVAFHTYSRPIPTPVKYLRPARETCEQCHWPQRFTGDKLLVKTKFQDDEFNTVAKTVLLLKVGGRSWRGGVGIHGRHLNEGVKLRYVSIDEARQVIPVVYYTSDTGKTTKYVASDIKATPQQIERGELRTMDCVDCHNRPTHEFELPEGAVDKAMADGKISPDLPYIKKKAVEALKVTYPDRDTARKRIVDSINDFYRDKYPQIYQTRRMLLEQSANQVADIYLRNIFPEMNIGWGVHPNNLGHNDFPGCFRCHDGSHTSADGQVITNDCAACHDLLAMDEKNPKVLTELGMQPAPPASSSK